MKKNRLIRKWFCIYTQQSAAISAIAMIVCIIGVAIEFPRDNSFDYLGLIIGILALMITFVVAWQIWTTIATKEEINRATEAADKLKEVEKELQKQRDFFETRNLEVRYLIDAHAKLHEAEKTNDLSGKYEAYAEALSLLLKSNVDLSYEQFDKAQMGLMSVVTDFESCTDPIEASLFIDREKEYEWHYENVLSELKKRENDIEDFKRILVALRDNRRNAIKQVKESGMGKRIEQNKQRLRVLEKRLRAKEAARQSSEAKDNPD